MYALMLHQTTLVTACIITNITNIRALTTMYEFMVYQITLVTICLITYITNMRVITTMYAFMPYQITLETVCLITHITNKRTLTTMYALFIQRSLVKNKSYTLEYILIENSYFYSNVYSKQKSTTFEELYYLHKYIR